MTAKIEASPPKNQSCSQTFQSISKCFHTAVSFCDETSYACHQIKPCLTNMSKIHDKEFNNEKVTKNFK